MHVELTNLGTLAVPVSSDQGKGFASLLDPGVPFTLDSEDVTVLNVGDNPTALEEFAEGLQAIIEKLGKLVTFWRDAKSTAGEEPPVVRVLISNHGENALRVLLGINTNEHQIAPGEGFDAVAPGYIEIRELGV